MSDMKHQFCYNCSQVYSFHDIGVERVGCSWCGAPIEFVEDIDPHKETTTINENNCGVVNGALVQYSGVNGILKPPEGTLIIRKNQFYKSYIRTIHFPNSLKGISIDAFYNSSYLTKVTFGNSLIIIGDSAFSGCQINKITLPESLLRIGRNAFTGNCFEEVILPNSVKTVCNCAFDQSSDLKRVILSNSMDTIEKGVFGYCSCLEEVHIGNSIKHIKNKAFINCRSLEHIDIPSSIISIEDHAFEGCTKLSQKTKDSILKINPNAHFMEVEGSF